MRAICFLQPGTNSRRIFLDFLQGYASAGWEISIFDLAPYWQHLSEPCTDRGQRLSAFTQHVREMLAQARPDVTFGMWANMISMLTHGRDADGTVTTIFDELAVPHVCFWLDAPQWAQNGNIRDLLNVPIWKSPALIHLTNSQSTATEMRDVMGFGRVVALPWGVTPRGEGSQTSFDAVAALGPGDPAPTPAALEELERDEPNMMRIRTIASERICRKLTNVLAAADIADAPAAAQRLVDSQLTSRHVPVLARTRLLLPQLTQRPRDYIIASMLLREIESHERAFTISWLSRRFNIATFGSGNLEPWNARATHLGELPYDHMGSAYRLGKVGLNIMRWQDDAGLNLKPFEITGAGVACLCQRRVGMDECFSLGNEIEAFDSPSHAAALLSDLLANPARRKQLAAAGHAKTTSSHTWTHRAHAMTHLLRPATRAPLSAAA
jgi:hypothetical protein